jgi:hypothetical protein
MKIFSADLCWNLFEMIRHDDLYSFSVVECAAVLLNLYEDLVLPVRSDSEELRFGPTLAQQAMVPVPQRMVRCCTRANQAK